MINKITYTLLLLISCFVTEAQQDPQYSQYMFNHIIINPAYAGSKDIISATLQTRKQWVGIAGSPQTTNFSIHGPLKNKRIGLGAHIITEQIGPKNWNSAYLDFAYRVKMGRGHLCFGISAGMVSYKYNLSKINYNDPSEVSASTINELNNNSTKYDSNFGIYYHNTKMFFGFGITHTTEPKLYQLVSTNNGVETPLTFSLKKHHFITFGRGFRVSDNLVFSPSIILKSVDGNGNMDLNLNFLVHKKLWLGTSFRTSKNLIFLVQYLINNKFKIGYSFDYVYGGISRGRNNSHEIMLGYNFKTSISHIISPRYL